ncbi:metallophosphoesterase [Microvirga sp. 2MCAF38]|uniref:metallophosphoesterase family protein n=1 Tax=Microvirga sp. 2MCAF38 TaxID=3232989 RepID=UPI003F9645AE
MEPVIDPRKGDTEDDASSTKQRSLLSLAGSLLAEISLPKLISAWFLLIGLPCLLLGVAPLFASIWIGTISSKASTILTGLWPALILVTFAVLGWFGGRPLLRLAETSFWSLNSLAVQPAYMLCREGLRHLVDLLFPRPTAKSLRPYTQAATAGIAGVLICGLALWVAVLVWPSTQWVGHLSDLAAPSRLVLAALANSILLIAGYLAVASLTWGIADATMAQPHDLVSFHPAVDGVRTWRIAHLSDIHTVGERFGFRIESGRAGPRGNERFRRTLAQLDKIHTESPLDLILITGDMTDAGLSVEWAEFFEALTPYPQLAERMLALPGNHDVNVVDKANPARLDLPTSPKKRLRQVRTISALEALQGARVQVVERETENLGDTLTKALAAHRANMMTFADKGSLRLSWALSNLWAALFPMVLPPDTEDGLGVIILNSNAETHFSFTNALGLVSTEQAQALEIATTRYPRACWIVALHHHVVEYPRPAKALSERIGTALVNGSWFVRHLQRLAGRAVIMHGHRHVDWIGKCGELLIVSAPSPVMEATNDRDTYFYVHTLARDLDGTLKLMEPQRINMTGNEPS